MKCPCYAKKILKVLFYLVAIYLFTNFLIFGVLGYVDYIKKAQVTRVYGEMIAVKTAVEASLFKGKVPVQMPAEQERNPEQFEWIGWGNTTNMIESFKLNGLNKYNKTYWIIDSTMGKNADTLLHGVHIVIFREGLISKEPSKNTQKNKKITKSINPTTTSEKTQDEQDYSKGRWYCRAYLGDNPKLIKELPSACTPVLEKYYGAYQLFLEDEKGERLTK